MADLAFSELYSNIRAAAGDWGSMVSGSVDADTYIFRDDMIDATLRIVLLDSGTYSESEAGDEVSPGFSTDVDRLLVVYSAALALILSIPDTDVAHGLGIKMTVKRKEEQLYYIVANIDRLLRRQTSTLPYAHDSDLRSVYNIGTRWANQLPGLIESKK